MKQITLVSSGWLKTTETTSTIETDAQGREISSSSGSRVTYRQTWEYESTVVFTAEAHEVKREDKSYFHFRVFAHYNYLSGSLRQPWPDFDSGARGFAADFDQANRRVDAIVALWLQLMDDEYLQHQVVE